MIGRVEFALGCRGLLYLARFDKQFLRHFDRTAGGALRSFWLALPILPFALFIYSQEMDQAVPSVGLYYAARCVGYAYGWILFPMVLLITGRLLDRDAEAPGCITIFNWVSLLWVALQLPILVAFAMSPNSGLATMLNIAALLYSVVVEGFLFLHCLRIQVWQAAVLVALDVVLGLFVIQPAALALGGAEL